MWRYLHTTVACRLTVQCISNTFKVKWYWVTPCLWKHYRERRMIFFNKNQKLYIQIFMFAVHESKYPQNISINLFFFSLKCKKKIFIYLFIFKQKTTLEFSVKKIQRPCLIHWASGFTLWCGPIYTNSLHWPVEVQQTLPALGLEVLDVLGLIEDQIAPRLSPEGLVILQHQLVRSDANVESIWLCPALRRESVTEWLIIFQHSVFHFIQYLSNMSTVAGN